MARHPKVFNRLYVAMVEAGEASGMLDTVLDRVAIQIEKETKIKRRVKGAMVYPTVVFTFASLVLIAMLMFIVPIFAKIFDHLGGELPMPTQMVVIGCRNLLRELWYIVFPLIGVDDLRASCATSGREPGRRMWDRFKLRIPMRIGEVVLQGHAGALLAHALDASSPRGVDIIKALEITRPTAGNWVVEQSLDRRAHEGAGGRPDQRAAHRRSGLPADGQPDGQDRRGDRRARARCSARSPTSTRTRSTRASSR